MLSFLQKIPGRRSGRRQAPCYSSPILAIECLDARLVLSAAAPAVGDAALSEIQVSGETDPPREQQSVPFSEGGEHMYPIDSEMSYPDMNTGSTAAMSDFSSPDNLVSLDEIEVMHELFANRPVVESGFQTVESQDEASPPDSGIQKQPQSLLRSSAAVTAGTVDTVHLSDEDDSGDLQTEELLPEVVPDAEYLELEVRNEQQTAESTPDRTPVPRSESTEPADNVESPEPVDIGLEDIRDAGLLDQLFLPGDIVEAIQNQLAGTRFQSN